MSIVESLKINPLSVVPVRGIPLVDTQTNLPQIISDRIYESGELIDSDVIVVASKIVSKNEGRIVSEEDIDITEDAIRLSEAIGKPAWVCQVIISESQNYRIGFTHRTIIARHRLGYDITSAGVDRLSDSQASILPLNPDLSALHLREGIERITNRNVSVLISDSDGRPDRMGAVAIALGISGMHPLRITRSGNKIHDENVADMIANAAGLVIGQRTFGIPVAVIRGLEYERNLSTGILNIIHQSQDNREFDDNE